MFFNIFFTEYQRARVELELTLFDLNYQCVQFSKVLYPKYISRLNHLYLLVPFQERYYSILMLSYSILRLKAVHKHKPVIFEINKKLLFYRVKLHVLMS